MRLRNMAMLLFAVTSLAHGLGTVLRALRAPGGPRPGGRGRTLGRPIRAALGLATRSAPRWGSGGGMTGGAPRDPAEGQYLAGGGGSR